MGRYLDMARQVLGKDDMADSHRLCPLSANEFLLTYLRRSGILQYRMAGENHAIVVSPHGGECDFVAYPCQCGNITCRGWRMATTWRETSEIGYANESNVRNATRSNHRKDQMETPERLKNRAVIVVDRGWIFAGDVTEKDGRIYLDRAVWVFRWTRIGFSAVVANPKQEGVDIRPLSTCVDIPTSAEIFRLPVSDSWGL